MLEKVSKAAKLSCPEQQVTTLTNELRTDPLILIAIQNSQVTSLIVIIIIMYIYHVLINALSAHMIHINLNMIFYTHV